MIGLIRNIIIQHKKVFDNISFIYYNVLAYEKVGLCV